MDVTKTINWLLEDNFPLAKYNTLRFILGKKENDSEVIESLQQMLLTPPISEIFKNQNPDGGFFQESWLKKKYREKIVRYGYLPKYKATIWQARFLAEANVPMEDYRIKKLGEFILKNTYSKENAFFYNYELACVNSDMVWALIKFGFEKDERVRRAFDLQIKYQRFDDGDWEPSNEWPYKGKNGHCYGPNSCITSIIHLLRTFTIIPDSYWNEEVRIVKQKIINFYIKHGVLDRKFKQRFSKSLASYVPRRVYPRLELMSPHFFSHDVVEVITNLLRIDFKIDLLEKSINFILSKQSKNGRWLLEETKKPMYSSWGKIGLENKWVTYRVLLMLKVAGKIKV